MNKSTQNIMKGIAAGLFASWVKSLVEPPLQRWGEKKYPPTAEELQLKGADVSNHPENMPPAILAEQVYHECTGSELTDEQKITAMKGILYALGTVIGLTYVSLVNRNRNLKIEHGITAGVVTWALTHGSTVPALGLQGKVSEMPKSWWVWEFGSHIVFGVVLEQSRKLVNKFF
mgnify:CR=1 FL=1